MLLPVPDNRLSLSSSVARCLSFVKVTVFFARFSPHSIFPNSLPLPRACVLFSELHCGFLFSLLPYQTIFSATLFTLLADSGRKRVGQKESLLAPDVYFPYCWFCCCSCSHTFLWRQQQKQPCSFFFCNVFYFSLRSKHHEKACKTERVLALK